MDKKGRCEMTQDIFTMDAMEGKGILAILDATGDTKIIWDRDNDDEISAAKRTFNDLIKKGFAAFSVKKNGDQNKKVTEFDPDEEKLILIPPMAGGV